jgi:hypothetical protein
MPTERALRKKKCIEPQADVAELQKFFLAFGPLAANVKTS